MLSVESIASRTITFILAGGRGERLYPLTKERAKPAVPIGCGYRLIDFTLSNCFTSRLRRIYVLTQYRAESVCQHIDTLLHNTFMIRADRDEFVICVPGERYLGTADAVLQNVVLLEKTTPDFVLILSSDHVYRMDYTSLLRRHIQCGARVTIGALEWPRASAHRFGVLETDRHGRVVAFEEKPMDPKAMAGKPTRSLVNMGIYVFTTSSLIEALNGPDQNAGHDFGKDVLPRIVRTGGVYAYNFADATREHGTYWRDVGSIDSYYAASMDLLMEDSPINFLDDGKWPLYGLDHGLDYLVLPDKNTIAAKRSIVADCTRVTHSVISRDVQVNCGADIGHSILMAGASVGRRAKIRRAIVEEGVHIPDGIEIGFDRTRDAEYGIVTENGIVVIPSNTTIR